MILINDRYEHIQEIGSGGFGEVALMYDRHLDRKVAVKRYNFKMMAKKLGSEERAQRYSVITEIKKGLLFHHPNIAKYYDAFSYDKADEFGIQKYDVGVMEYLPNGDFESIVHKHGIESPIVKQAIIGTLRGIQYLHKNHIIHRDIKPQNVLFDKNNVVKIMDFGISKDVGSDNSSSLMMATPEYAAPEQIEPVNYSIEGKIHPNIDLWQFGVMLYYLCTGEFPFGKRNNSDTEQSILRTNILTKASDDLDWGQIKNQKHRTIIKKCLVKDANQRSKEVDSLVKLLDPSHNYDDDTVFEEKPLVVDDTTKSKFTHRMKYGVAGIFVLIFLSLIIPRIIKSDSGGGRTIPIAPHAKPLVNDQVQVERLINEIFSLPTEEERYQKLKHLKSQIATMVDGNTVVEYNGMMANEGLEGLFTSMIVSGSSPKIIGSPKMIDGKIRYIKFEN